MSVVPLKAPPPLRRTVTAPASAFITSVLPRLWAVSSFYTTARRRVRVGSGRPRRKKKKSPRDGAARGFRRSDDDVENSSRTGPPLLGRSPACFHRTSAVRFSVGRTPNNVTSFRPWETSEEVLRTRSSPRLPFGPSGRPKNPPCARIGTETDKRARGRKAARGSKVPRKRPDEKPRYGESVKPYRARLVHLFP